MHRQDRGWHGPAPQPINHADNSEKTPKLNDIKTNVNAPSEVDKEDIAARSVEEMGYSKPVINNAVETLRKQGRAQYTATDIMQIILDKEETSTPAKAGTTSAPAKAGTNSAPAKAGTTTYNSIVSSTSSDCASLQKENRDLKEQMICKICLDKDACVVFLPCGHMVTCMECAQTIRKCCICRKLIQGTVRAYL